MMKQIFVINVGTATGIKYEEAEKHTNHSDDEVIFRVQPKYKAMYFWYDTIAIILGIGIAALLLGVISINYFDTSEYFWLVFLPLLSFSIILVLIKGIVISLKKKQLKNTEYLFYRTKVIYVESFLSRHEKELKYKHIRECILEESFGLRMFGLGNVVLYTNSEGFSSGMVIGLIENARDVYKKIKELIDK